jgi:citrate lyase beta subunit
MTALKPCPFCGGASEIWRASIARTAWVACMGKCVVLVSKEYTTDAEAITAWNTRADLHDAAERKLAKAVEALRGLLRFAENTESELGIILGSADTARAVLAEIEKGAN